MKTLINSILFFLAYAPVEGLLGAQEIYPSQASKQKIVQLIESGDTADAIVKLKTALQNLAPNNQGNLLVEIAKVYALNQDQLSAYTFFNQALKTCPRESLQTMSASEQVYFNTVYTIYLAEDGQGPVFQEKVEEALKAHPEFKSLLMFKAALSANTGNLVSFFDSYWQAYSAYAETPLSLKIQGSIAHRLYELSDDKNQRDEARKVSIDLFTKVFESNPEDVSLFNRIVLLSNQDERKQVLNKLIPLLATASKPSSRKQCWMSLEIVQQMNYPDELLKLHKVVRMWFPQSKYLDAWEKDNLRGQQ